MEKINTGKKNTTNIVFKVSRLSNFKFGIFKTFKFCRSIDNSKGTFIAQDSQLLTFSPPPLFAKNMQKKKKMDSAKKRMEICGK